MKVPGRLPAITVSACRCSTPRRRCGSVFKGVTDLEHNPRHPAGDMTHVHEAIRNDQRLAIDLIIPGPPDMTITDVVGELGVDLRNVLLYTG